MADKNVTSFKVSVTPKVSLDAVATKYQAHTVIHEDVRRSLGGSGEIEGDDTTVAGFADGTSTTVTSNGGTVPTHDGNTDLIYIKNTGFLFGTTTACVAADTALVKHDGDVIGTLKSGEAMVLPKPTGAVITLGSGSAHVAVEVLVVGT
jgi:hypothetical protein